MPDSRIDLLRHRLASHYPARVPADIHAARASVALLVRPGAVDLELLLIKRIEFAGDPWSGHMAFPGGRSEPQDADGVATAVRETREEVGVDLDLTGSLIGTLDPTQPRSAGASIIVSPYVFGVPSETSATPNCEVQLTLWIPLRELLHPEAAIEYLHDGGGKPRGFPAFRYQGHTIWGLTHRILTQFLSLAVPQTAYGGEP